MQMQEYKFFFLDDAGHVYRSEDHSYREDRAALEAAQEMNATVTVEIWQTTRLIAQIKSGEKRSD